MDDSVRRAYDEWSSSYDEDRNATRDLDARVLRAHAGALALAGEAVLELGCGTGKNTVWLAAQACRVLGLDVSEGMLARARARVAGAANVELVLHDLRHPWPVADGSQGRVVGNLVLEHIEQLEPIFAEAARVLRRGGRLFFCELHPYRQLGGAQARFGAVDGTLRRVDAFLHQVSDYVSAGLAAGLSLTALGEWRDEAGDSPIPRLLSVSFEKL